MFRLGRTRSQAPQRRPLEGALPHPGRRPGRLPQLPGPRGGILVFMLMVMLMLMLMLIVIISNVNVNVNVDTGVG